MANLFSENPIVEIVAVPGRDGTDIPIDDRLSDTSENPVQNKVVKQAIDNAVSATEDYATQAVEAAYGQLDEIKQDVLDDSGAGQNIKTINGESILGTGNLEVGSQIEVDDALNPTSENPVQNRTLYQAFNELNNDVIGEVSRLANRVYGYTHEAIVTDDLENDYNLIINGGYQRLYNPPMDWETDYASYYYLDDTIYRLNTSSTWDWSVEYYKRYTPHSDLENVSAVGMLAVLNHGIYTAVPTQPDDWATNYDKYFYLTSEGYIFNTNSTWSPNRSYFSYSGDVVRAQGNRLFINGDESNGYTFRGVNSQNGIEIVKIWYFQNGSNQLTLSESFGYDPFVLWLKIKNTVNVSDDCLNAQTVMVEGNSPVSANSIIKNIEYLDGTQNIVIPNTAKCVKSNMLNLPSNVFSLKTGIEEVVLPELISIYGGVSGQKRNGFYGCSSLKKISFPKLQRIEGGTDYSYAFGSVISVELPESVEYVGSYAFANNQSITLNCPNATFNDLWCYRTPNSFTMCSDWAASINIAKATNTIWSQSQFEDLITTKLKQVGFVERPNNDGNADYDSSTGTYTQNTSGTGAYNTAKYLTTPNANLANMSQELIDLAFSKGWELRGA